MPKHNLGELGRKLEILEEELKKAKATATAALIIGSLSLATTLLYISLS